MLKTKEEVNDILKNLNIDFQIWLYWFKKEILFFL
jgi:hypothetical protein